MVDAARGTAHAEGIADESMCARKHHTKVHELHVMIKSIPKSLTLPPKAEHHGFWGKTTLSISDLHAS